MAGKRPSGSRGTRKARVTYEQRTERLSRAVDLAEAVLEKARIPQNEKRSMIEFGRELKTMARSPASSRLRTVKSLGYLEDAFLGYWNEAPGAHVDRFWKLLAKNGIDFERRDVVETVLARKKIATRAEYDTVVDTIVPLFQEGRLTDAQLRLLQRMIGAFELGHRD